MKSIFVFLFSFSSLFIFSQNQLEVDSIGEYIFFYNNTDTFILHQDSTKSILKINPLVKKKEKFIDYFSLMPKEVREYTPNDFFNDYNGQSINSVEIFIVDRFDEPVFSQENLDSANFIKNKKGDYSASLIRKQLLFKEGDTLNSRLFADTERNIRENTIYKDAIIKVKHTEHINGVDVKVYVHANRHWRAIFVGAPTSLTVGGSFYDFWGINQSIKISGSGIIDPADPYSFQSTYNVSNILKSQINLDLDYTKENQAHTYKGILSRDFYAYNTKWAGLLEIDNNARKISDNGISNNYNNKFLNTNAWLARSFALNKIFPKSENMRLIISGRATMVKHYKIPENQPFQNFVNKQFYITSIGLANRDWYGFEELYKFRQFDYVPKGFNTAIFTGYEINQFLGGRYYNGLTTNYNKHYEKFGFMQNQLKLGSYIRNKAFEQITIQNSNAYFTNKAKIGKLEFRQFINTNTTLSFNRPYSEFYNIGTSSIKGFTTQKLIGTKSCVINLESVFYTPINWWSSTGNFFFFADLGVIGESNTFIFKNTVHQGYGAGIRFQNRILAIDFMELSFGYYPKGYILNEQNWGFQAGDIEPRTIGPENLFSPNTLEDIY